MTGPATAVVVFPSDQTPIAGTVDAAGSDSFDPTGNTTRVWTHPGRGEFSRLLYSLDPGHKADLSLDGGVTAHIQGLPGNSFAVLDALPITGDIHGKNATPGSNYTNLRILAVW